VKTQYYISENNNVKPVYLSKNVKPVYISYCDLMGLTNILIGQIQITTPSVSKWVSL
jgi:hypothetical protein